MLIRGKILLRLIKPRRKNNNFLQTYKNDWEFFLSKIFWGSNTSYGEMCLTHNAHIWNYGAFILPGKTNLSVGSYKLTDLPPGSLNAYLHSQGKGHPVWNYVEPSLSDSEGLAGKCIGGGYFDICGGSLSITAQPRLEICGDSFALS